MPEPGTNGVGASETKRCPPTVLCALGDVPTARRIVELLADAFRVEWAADDARAVAIVEARHPDLVVLCHDPPKSDAFATCRALRATEHGRLLRVIIVSDSAGPADAARAFEAGADDYVPKLLISAQLRARAHTWLLRTGRSQS